MGRPKKYFYVHLLHGALVSLLLLSGAVLYSDVLKALVSSFKWEIRQLHSIVGIIYFIFVLVMIPTVLEYARLKRTWKKMFHICIFITCSLGWLLSGGYLWINSAVSFGVRQFALDVHDALSMFIIPWILGHILLWWSKKYLRMNKKITKRSVVNDQEDVISRRDVVIFFAGIIAAFFFGGFFRWFRPISDSFLVKLGEEKRRGYFRIYSVRTENPVFDPATWRLSIEGKVEQALTLSFEDLLNLPKRKLIHDFHCVTGWSVTSVRWEGIPFTEIVTLVKSSAPYVKIYSSDLFYTETYELSQLLENDVLLVYQLDDRPLIESQGAPLRLFHPNMYGYKSIKWVSRIEFTDRRDQGYWEEKEGYDQDGYIT